METNKKINKKILLLTLKIRNDYPELQIFLNEMPVTIPVVENPKINARVLEEYFNSLENLLQKYASNNETLIHKLKKTNL
ncbi:hypothetical protein ACSVH2_10620 [Flavobacterium sp. RSB2_4_14]|uniref:hypothetical protein n=1 Tax=Flavobacterium sp. RSB2_4_14 TaxID=3447665 RepID=UPI003F36F38F